MPSQRALIPKHQLLSPPSHHPIPHTLQLQKEKDEERKVYTVRAQCIPDMF